MNSIILLILIAQLIEQISSQFGGDWNGGNGGGGGWGGGGRHRHHPGGFNGFGMPPPRPPPGWFSRWGGGFNGPPSPWEWRRRAWRFCRRFPGHPACRGGRSPEFSEVQNMEMQTRTQFLPRIPRITIQDPLIGVSPELTQIARSYRNYGYLDQSSYQSITTLCRSFNCREQSQESEQFRNTIQEKVVNFEQTISGQDNADNINLRFDRTLQIKQVLLEQANLTAQVTPEDNGVFDKDLLLTENQAHFLLNELGQGGKGKDIPNVPEPPPSPGGPGGPSGPGAPQVQNQQSRPPWQNQQNNQNNQWNNNQQGGNQWGGQNWNGGGRWLRDSLGFSESFDERQKRAAIYFEQNLVQKWDLKQPIPYSFDASLDTQDKADVTNAIKEIEQKTCIRFKLGTNLKGNHINYQKIDSPTFCGLSYVGRVEPANPVYLSFQCGNAKGVAIHETMHALGVAHQHLRMDRDQHITVDWSNVNPRFYDTFVVSDSKLYTTYGVKYDYGSIMHYNAYTAAVNITKPTMVPKVSPATNLSKLGQRDAMSASDVELLKKMYCVKPGCDDKNVYCGAWALKNLCTTNTWLQANCKKSCNLCN